MAGNRVLRGEQKAYPRGLQTIPLASYMKITRFEYHEGLKRARQNGMQGPEAALGGSALANKAKNAVAGTVKFTYGNFSTGAGDVEAFNKNIEALAKDQLRSGQGAQAAKQGNDLAKQVKAGDFSNLEYPLSLRDGTEIKSAEQLADIKNKAMESKDAVSSVYFLPMPNEFQYEYGADWSNKFRLGTMARLLDSPAALGQMALTAAGSAALNVGGQLLGATSGEFLNSLGGGTGLNMSSVLGSAFKGAVNPLGSTDSLSTNNVLGLAGLAPNENAITMFSRMNPRSFTLSFEFFARDEQEADDIDRIINGFKTGMHPTTTAKGTGGVLGFPDIFMLEPWFGAVDEDGKLVQSGVPHPMMPRSKLCALTSLSVNSTPSNNFVTTKDGKLPLQTVNLSFTETTVLTQSDLETGTF
tara:strand:+ start:2660 stop:3898 length:1239 start_codon:yes stop_codon:yes gene_type:complete